MKSEENRFGLPPHGSRRRYRNVGCRCIACTRGAHGTGMPDELRWPYRWLDKKLGEQVAAWYSEEQIAQWKKYGLGDYEADEVCIRMGVLPCEVFPGYTDAGLDAGTYP